MENSSGKGCFPGQVSGEGTGKVAHCPPRSGGRSWGLSPGRPSGPVNEWIIVWGSGQY